MKKPRLKLLKRLMEKINSIVKKKNSTKKQQQQQ